MNLNYKIVNIDYYRFKGLCYKYYNYNLVNILKYRDRNSYMTF